MDKNTITGFVLMIAVFLGFFWLTKPSAEDVNADNTETATTSQTADHTTPAVLLSENDAPRVAAAIRAAGATDSTGTTYLGADYAVTLDREGNATYTDAQGSMSVPAILAGDADLDQERLYAARTALKGLIDNASKYEGFTKYLGGQNTVTTLQNDLVSIDLSSRGAMASKVTLKKYTTEVNADTALITLFSAGTDSYGFLFNTADQRLDTREFNFTTTVESDTTVYFSISPAPGAEWGIRYTLAPDSYVLRMDVVQKGIGAVIPANTASMGFDWTQKMVRNELGRTFEERNSAIYYKYIGESVDDLDAHGNDSETLNGRLRWVAFKNQFFSSVIIARDCFSGAELKSVDLKDDLTFLKDMSMAATLPYTVADGTAASFDFYFGPNDYPILSDLDDTLGHDEDLSLTRLIPLGWGLFRWINTLIIIPVFTFLGSFISSYGLIIFLLTVFIKLLLFPFTYKSFKSQAKMRVLAPEIKEINEKYPNPEDAMKRNTETMALYSRAGASPLSGCLPMLLQMPVLIAMFSFFPSAIELRGQSFLWAHDLSAPDYVLTLPFTIPFYGNHVSLFCLLMTVINILYMRISMQSQPQNNSMPGMKMMQYFMPVMFLFIFNDYASGLSYYYLLSLLITVIQSYIFRHVIDEKKVRAELLANAKKPRKKSGFMARLEEAQRQAQAAQRQQQSRRR
ncbi:MAG: membrane protein insertase YidC [Muribaculaceae bacterium]|nr:membrane protein insertase YidC [Muribaculaceae bacterium]